MLHYFLFFLALALTLFLPGYTLTLAVFSKKNALSNLERFVLSCGLSIVIVNLIIFLLYRFNIPITALSSFLGILIFTIACISITKLKHAQKIELEKKHIQAKFQFSKNQYILICLFLFFTVLVKTLYLTDTVLPTATDMGHHMYWAKWIFERGTLPDYEGMPDFIIGEHVIFGIIGLISSLSFFGAFPVVVLFGINILSILAIFILIRKIFDNNNIAIFSLLFLGVLYAISSPQAKFVSGGVVGNIMGNFFLPLAFYLFYRAISFLTAKDELYKKNLGESRIFFSLALLVATGLFYTHHLSSLVFLLTLSSAAILFCVLNFKDMPQIFSRAAKIILSPSVLVVFFAGLIFFSFVFTPTYMQKSAVDTALGSPTKSTRTGLTIENLRLALGEERLALGALGLILLLLYFKKKHPGYAILAAWAGIIFLATTKPHLIFIDIPSSRIGTYLSYPLSVLSAYALVAIFQNARAGNSHRLLQGAFLFLLLFSMMGGISDSVREFKTKINHQELAQTFHASKYTAFRLNQEDVILKDHNYILADSWMKLFYMKGYKYPQSRGYLKRYEDTAKPREMCTLHMISNPNSKEAVRCFSNTKTNIVIVNPEFDSNQFKKLKNFNQLYASPEIAIFYRTQ